jgi:hypothetical protein
MNSQQKEAVVDSVVAEAEEEAVVDEDEAVAAVAEAEEDVKKTSGFLLPNSDVL